MRSFTLRLLGAILCITCAVSATHAQAKPQPTPRPLTRITLLQLNDVYQTAALDKGANAGLARVATLRKKILAESPNTLFLLAGDTISPSVASTIFKGKQIIAAIGCFAFGGIVALVYSISQGNAVNFDTGFGN